MTITRALADIVAATRFDDVPPTAIEMASQVMLDGIGVIVAGLREPQGLGRITVEYVKQLGGAPDATVLGTDVRTSVINAAYANGTLCHALDFDNTWWPLNHPTSPSLPAVLAIAEREECAGRAVSGRDVAVAMVLAFEVQGRMRAASAGAQTGTGFHKPGVSGTMGAVTAAARLLALDPEQLVMAYGIAGSRCGSLSVNTGTMTKSSHSGNAARMGTEAALLAGMGFTGHSDIFGDGGFFETFYGAGNYDLSLFLKNFGDPYRMLDPGVGFKKHPSNYFTHRPIDAALELRRKHALRPEQIDRVVVDFPTLAYVNRPAPATGLDGKFSIQYATTIALLDGTIAIESFSDARRFSNDVVTLLPRVTLNVRDDIPTDFNDTWASVQVYLDDGRVLQERCDKPRGLWGVPLTRKERLAKFQMCMTPIFSAAQIADVVKLVEDLPQLPRISPLTSILLKSAHSERNE